MALIHAPTPSERCCGPHPWLSFLGVRHPSKNIIRLVPRDGPPLAQAGRPRKTCNGSGTGFVTGRDGLIGFWGEVELPKQLPDDRELFRHRGHVSFAVARHAKLHPEAQQGAGPGHTVIIARERQARGNRSPSSLRG